MPKRRAETLLTDLSQFGDELHPIHASSLPQLIKCGMRAVLLSLGNLQDHSSQAADTGSVAHEGAAHWHRSDNKDLEGAFAELERAARDDFPQADVDKAKKHLAGYCADPRNTNCKTVLVEEQLTLTLDGDIFIVGTLDQVRENSVGNLSVWDIKTGSLDGWVMIHEYAMQIAAYAVGASLLLGKDVQPGGLIRTQTYLKRGVDASSQPDGVFWEIPYTLKDCELLLSNVVRAVRYIRAGQAEFGPGMHCSYCPAQGLSNCIPLYRSLEHAAGQVASQPV